jgi:hypothetical protein
MSVTHCCSVRLIITGGDLDPDAVTAALGMEPDKSWRRGERKGFTRTDGSVRQFDSIHEEGGWTRRVPDRYRDEPLDRQLILWVARLHELSDALRALRRRGWVIELDCFAATSEVVVLSHEDLRGLADLGIDLGLTLACGSEHLVPQEAEPGPASASGEPYMKRTGQGPDEAETWNG